MGGASALPVSAMNQEQIAWKMNELAGDAMDGEITSVFYMTVDSEGDLKYGVVGKLGGVDALNIILNKLLLGQAKKES